EKASRKLIKKGVGAVIVTLGEEGAYIVSMSLSKKIPSFKIKVVDTVGAGDAFSGGLAYALVNGMDLKDAVRFANAAAAVSCTKYGAQASMPKLSEVRRLLKKG
ncbi:ribokinase, partial [archaeon]